MGDWCELCNDLLVEIADKLTLSKDIVAFRGVCTSWRSAIDAAIEKFKSKFHVPQLMVPSEPDPDCKKYFSSKGWYIKVTKDGSVSLLHPFSNVLEIHLPHMSTFKTRYHDLYLSSVEKYTTIIQKCVLSASPSLASDYIVMVIHGWTLAYYKSGDIGWTEVDTRNTWRKSNLRKPYGKHVEFCDVIFFNGVFYAINRFGLIMACDVRGDNRIVARAVAQFPDHLSYLKRKRTNIYLLESGGALLVATRGVVCRSFEQNGMYKYTTDTKQFKVFEVKLSTSSSMWTRIHTLGKRALFLGRNSSFSVDVFDASKQCKPNCIYFTADHDWLGRDMGMYNMEDGSVEQHFKANPRGMWVDQNLNNIAFL